MQEYRGSVPASEVSPADQDVIAAMSEVSAAALSGSFAKAGEALARQFAGFFFDASPTPEPTRLPYEAMPPLVQPSAMPAEAQGSTDEASFKTLVDTLGSRAVSNMPNLLPTGSDSPEVARDAQARWLAQARAGVSGLFPAPQSDRNADRSTTNTQADYELEG